MVTPPTSTVGYALNQISFQAGTCVAVGESNTDTGLTSTYQPVVATESGGSWTLLGSPNLPTVPGGILNGVSCVPGTCIAVGQTYSQTTSSYQVLAMSSPFSEAQSVPTVTAVAPSSGPVTGGTAITVSGTGFVSGASVVIGQGSGPTIGAIAATNVVVVSPTEITAVTGGGARAGTFSLFVITPGGTSAANVRDDFTY